MSTTSMKSFSEEFELDEIPRNEMSAAFARLLDPDEDVVEAYWKASLLPIEIDQEDHLAARRHIKFLACFVLMSCSGQ